MDAAAPDWQVPKASAAGWSPTRWLTFANKAHIQEFDENGADRAHFPIVHASERAGMDILDPVGMPFRFDLRTAYPCDGSACPGSIST